MTDDTGAEKQRLRAAVRLTRAARSPEIRQADRERLTSHLSALVEERGARLVTCYLPSAGEPDTSGFLDWSQAHGIDVLLPVSLADSQLEWSRLGPEGTAHGRHGLQEPVGPRLPVEAAANVDLLIIPASAVDRSGIRMGWGLGYFDRALAKLTPRPPVFAVVHDDEIYPALPSGPLDIPVTGAVTPSGIRVFPIGPR